MRLTKEVLAQRLQGAHLAVGGVQLPEHQLRWHRAAGWLLIPSGLTVALSGLWMTLFYRMPAYDGAKECTRCQTYRPYGSVY